MLIPCKEIASELEHQLKKEVFYLKSKNIYPKLVTILVGSAEDQLSFVKIKNRVAQKIGVDFELVHKKDLPDYKKFLNLVFKKASDKKTSGIIIQQPIPKHFSLEEIYAKIPKNKEIEGFRPDSNFHFPLSLSVLTGLKYCILKLQNDTNVVKNSVINFQKDKRLFLNFLVNKTVTIAGRGQTGGAPISKSLREIGAPFTITHSNTVNSDKIYLNSDVIISATGQHILNNNNVKKNSILLNVGLRKESNKLQGDYFEEDILDLASFYTKTPGGLGPLDVLYLFKNVIEASKIKTL